MPNTDAGSYWGQIAGAAADNQRSANLPPSDVVNALTRERDELRTANVGLVADMADIAAERDKAWIEVTHRVGWEERCLRVEAALRQILEDPDAKILDSHRDDGWETLGRASC